MKKILAVAAAVLMIVLFTSFVFAVDNGPIYEPLMATETLAEFRSILLAESNRNSVMGLTEEEINDLSVHVFLLHDALDAPTSEDDEIKDEMLETLSIFPNGPMELYGQPTTYAYLSSYLGTGDHKFTSNTELILDGNVTLKGTIWADGSATVTIRSTGNFTITRDSNTNVMFRVDDATASMVFDGSAGQIIVDGAGASRTTAMAVTWGTLRCNNVLFKNAINTLEDSTWNGGAIGGHGASNINLTNTSFSNCQAQVGGAIRTSGVLTISGGTFQSNKSTKAGGNGGAISATKSVSISGCTFDGNSAAADTGHGGTIYLTPTADCTIENCVIKNSTSGNGSAIFMQGSSGYTVTLKNSLIYGCAYGDHGDGGTIRCGGGNSTKLLIDGCVIRNNTNIRGAAVYWNSQTAELDILDTQILNNTTTINGGALYLEGITHIIRGSSTSMPASNKIYTTLTSAPADGAVTCTLIKGNKAEGSASAGENIETGIGGAICFAGYGMGPASGVTESVINLNSGTILDGNSAKDGGAVAFLLSSANYPKGYTYRVNVKSGATIQNNSSTEDGAAFYLSYDGTNGYKPYINMTGGTIQSNTAGIFGGAFMLNTSTAAVDVSGGNIRSNTADRGGAAYLKTGVLNLSGGTVGGSGKGNTATLNNGGAFYVEGGTLNLTGGEVCYNSAPTSGGAICTHLSGVVNISSNAKLNNNTATYGGAINLDGGSVNFSGGTISSNTARDGGGVRVNGGTFTMTGGTISSNLADNSSTGHGGGISANGGATYIRGGTIGPNNDARDSGGGLYVSGASTACEIGVKNCSSHTHPQITGNTVGYNSKYGNALGGGIAVEGGTVNMYCGNVDGKSTYGYAGGHTSTYYQSSGTFNYCGGYLGVGTFVYNGTFNTRNADNTANVTKYTVTYDIHKKRDQGTWGAAKGDPNGYFTQEDWQRYTRQILRTNQLTLPSMAQMNNDRYTASGQNGIYSLMGWANSATNADNFSYANQAVGQTITLTGDKTLYGVWYQGTTGTVTFKTGYGNNATHLSKQYNVTTGTGSFTITNPTRTGYTFNGWTVSGSGHNWSNLGTGTTIQIGGKYGSPTMTAQWTANTNTKYVVNHYRQDTSGNYPSTPYATENKTGTSDASITVNTLKKTYTGFSYSHGKVNGTTTQTTTIAPDGSRVINLYYSRNKYSVTLNKGTGISSVTGAGEYYYNASVTINATPASGYSWSNWTGTHSTTTRQYTFDMPAGNVTDTANATANTYYVKYNGNGATSGSMSNSQHTYDVAKNLTANAFSRAYLVTFNANNGSVSPASATATATFNGWATSPSGSKAYNNQQSVTNLATSGTFNLYAHWTLGSVTLPTPSRTGYTFNGWYTAASGGTKVGNGGASYTPSADTTLYAQWTANTNTPYKVQHWQQKLGGGADYNSTNFTLITADTQNLTGTTATNVTPAVKTYTGFASPNTQTVTIAADGSTVVNYYYTRNSYSVTLSKGTGISAVSGAGSYQYGATVSINATVSTGYTWSGWTGAQTTSVQNHSFSMPAQNVEYTAHATPISYTVTYHGNGNTGGSTEISSHTYDAYKALTVNGFTKIGYSFAGWGTSVGGEVVYSNGQSVKNLASTQNANVDLYAKWTANSYTVKFNANSGSGMTADQSFTYDVAQALRLNGFSKTGYTFAGWNTAANGSGTLYANGASVENLITDGSITLYAQWTPITYKIQFNANGGTGTMQDMSVVYGELVTLSVNGFSKPGYKFLGWSGSNGIDYDDKDSVINLADTNGAVITMTAKWELAAADFTINVAGLANGQSAVIKISGNRADGDPFKDITFAVIGNGVTMLPGLPVGVYTITVNGSWTWRYDCTSETVDTSNPENTSVTIVFSSNNERVKWLNAYGQTIN